jgi:hypothetical protein
MTTRRSYVDEKIAKFEEARSVATITKLAEDEAISVLEGWVPGDIQSSVTVSVKLQEILRHYRRLTVDLQDWIEAERKKIMRHEIHRIMGE